MPFNQNQNDSSYRQNFDLDKKNKIHYLIAGKRILGFMSKIAKFGRELL
jgi:hypothetical protein